MAGPAAQTRPHAAGLRRLSLIIALAAPSTAHAGAWVTGEDRSITSVGYSESDGVAAFETDVYSEESLTDRIALVARAYYAQDALGFAEDETDIGLKVAAWRGRRFVTALQAGATYVSAPTDAGCDRWGGEARALGGVSSREGRVFANLEAAYRYSPGCNHARYELTLGRRTGERWLALGQAFVDDDLAFGETVKAQASVVRFTKEGRGVQLSLRFSVDEGSVIEPTLIVGYWSRKRAD